MQPPSADELFGDGGRGEEQPSMGLQAPETAIMLSHIKEVIWSASVTSPRTLQQELGPSELNTPCQRQLAYKCAGMKPVNHSKDSWAANVGSAVHSWIEQAFEKADAGSGRYLVEETVHYTTRSGRKIIGHVDLIDRATGWIIDWKVAGANSARRYRRKGSSEQYIGQLQVYGLMVRETLGITPLRVGNFYVPRDGTLEDGLFGWSAPWDERQALAIIERYERISDQARLLPLEVFWSVFEAEPSALCGWCPFYNPDAPDSTKGCRGA